MIRVYRNLLDISDRDLETSRSHVLRAGKDIFDDGVLRLEGMFAALDVRLCWRCSSLVPAAGSTVALYSFVMLRPGAETFVGVRC